MTKKELETRIAEIEQEAKDKKTLAYLKYVSDNAKYKVGDIITDGVRTIRIEKITYSVYYDVEIIYWGATLTKKGEPRKDGEHDVIYEERIKTKIGDGKDSKD